jgi:hypothetical protein
MLRYLRNPKAFWPGIRPGDSVVEIHFGAILLDPQTHNPLMSRGASLDFYWYPWVCNPHPTARPTLTSTPTTTPTSTPTAALAPALSQPASRRSACYNQ